MPLCLWSCYCLCLEDLSPLLCLLKFYLSFKAQSIYNIFGNTCYLLLWFSHSVMSLQPHGLQHTRPPCPSPTPGAYWNSHPSQWWCHPTISFSVVPFSCCPQSFPASRSFPMSQLFTSGGQSIGVSASTSVLPMNTQDWSPLEWTGWISLQSKGLPRVFSNTTVQKHQFFRLSFLSSPTLTSIHDYWKIYSLDETDLCGNVSPF